MTCYSLPDQLLPPLPPPQVSEVDIPRLHQILEDVSEERLQQMQVRGARGVRGAIVGGLVCVCGG